MHGTLALVVGSLLLAEVTVPAAGAPTVAVVRGDLLGGGGPDVAAESRARYDAVLRALEAAGIPYQETSDSAVASWGLPAVPVAILPYSRAVSDQELLHLRAFLKRPARLIVFFTTRDDLAAELGATLGPVTRESYPGEYFSVHPPDGRLLGQPDAIRLDARMIRPLQPTATGRSFGVWHSVSGRRSPHQAIVLSERGAVVGAAPTAESKTQLVLLLRALVGHFAPELWTALAPRDPRQIGPVGHYGSLTDFDAALRRATGEHLAGSRSDVHEALTLLAGIPDLLAAGRQQEAIDASKSARALGQRAWYRSYPSVSPEIRGVWASDTVDGGWDRAAETLAQAGLNACFPYMASGAAAYYPSDVLPRCANSHGDPLRDAIAAGRAHGIAVHPRILGLFTMGASAELKAWLKSQGRIARTPDGFDVNWLCPSNHDNRLQIINTALEMVTRYGADGVQFDYLRYSWKDQCVCATCRACFEAETGVKAVNWPRDVLTGAHKGRWLDWRREKITSLLRTIRQKLREARPDAVLSASVFINWESHRDTFGQDWKRWIDEGLVDFVAPMTYVADIDKFQGWVTKQEAWAGNKVPVAMGIGPFADIDPRITPQGVLDQIQASRRLGCEGFVLFNYRRALAEDYLPLMALGATSTRVPLATRARG